MQKKHQEYVIRVDVNDKELGTLEKMEAHRNAVLHRAISVFICNTRGEWLLQRRALGKYHSSGMWSNACCSHPYPGETNLAAANRRLMEEMGLKAPLKKLFHFVYKAELDNELTEHELDHVFFGVTDEEPDINTHEVSDWKYISYEKLLDDVHKMPGNYTFWFRKIVERMNTHIVDHFSEQKV